MTLEDERTRMPLSFQHRLECIGLPSAYELLDAEVEFVSRNRHAP